MSKDLNSIYRGVVEGVADPLKLGRVQIRVFGVHTPLKEKSSGGRDGVPTAELPWALPANPIAEGSVSGFGVWAVPVQGSHVYVFFENGNPSTPVYFASVGGQPINPPDTKKGFNDPDGVYPLKHRLNQPDMHRLARGESSDTIVTAKNASTDKNVKTGDGSTWSEPNSSYNAKYPDNLVIATHGGNIIELDSTPGKERIHIFHSSNSYIEIDVDGNMVIRNNKDKYEIVLGGKNIHVKDNLNETTDGNKSVRVEGNDTAIVNKNRKSTIDGNDDKILNGNDTQTVGGSLTINVTGSVNVTGGVVTIDGGGGSINGVVTGDCICALTKKPHIQCSSSVKASM